MSKDAGTATFYDEETGRGMWAIFEYDPDKENIFDAYKRVEKELFSRWRAEAAAKPKDAADE